MRRSVEFLTLMLLVFMAAPVGAEEMAWHGTLEAEFSALPEPLIATGTGMADVNSGPPLISLRLDGNITASGVVPVTDPNITPTTKSFRFRASVKSGTLSPFAPSATPQLTNSNLRMGGFVRICMIIADCAAYIHIPFNPPGADKGVGIGGMWTVGDYGTGVRISVESAPWTLLTADTQVTIPTTPTGTQSEVVTVSTFGFAHGPFSWAGSAGATGGLISVVVPVQIKGDLRAVGFSRLTLKFVPEPASGLLIGAGVMGIATLGRRRVRF